MSTPPGEHETILPRFVAAQLVPAVMQQFECRIEMVGQAAIAGGPGFPGPGVVVVLVDDNSQVCVFRLQKLTIYGP
jgi:hypothetical protein